MFKSIETINIQDIKRKPLEFYLKHILPMPKHTVGMIASRGGMGKTFLSLRLASEFVRETGKKALVWFSEDEPEIIANRFDKMIDDFKISKETDNNIHYMTTSPKQFALKDKGVFKANYEAIADLRKDCLENNVGLVVIDPLLAFYGGDENDNSQARIFMQVFLDWAKQDGINILFIHHAQKGDGSSRGASAFIDATRYVYELHYPMDDKKVNIDFDKKDRGIRVVRLVKDNHNAFHHVQKLFNGAGEGELKILPSVKEVPIVYESISYKINDDEKIQEPIDTVTVSIADHNDEKNSHGFNKQEIKWDDLLDVVTMGKAYAPAGFIDGHRKNENYLGDTNVVFLDIDDGMTFIEAQTVFKDLQCFIFTTRSHQKDKKGKICDRFRVAIKLDKPINLPVIDYKIAMQSIFDFFGNVDRATKDPARFYFSSPSDCDVWYSQGTEKLNWESLYKKQKSIRLIEDMKRKEYAEQSKPTTPSDIETALYRIDPDCEYSMWVEIGMAIHSELGEGGMSIWDNWSRGGSKYNEREMETKWRSFKNGSGVSIGTLFHHAKNGYASDMVEAGMIL
jgi:replicative DNA helicase